MRNDNRYIDDRVDQTFEGEFLSGENIGKRDSKKGKEKSAEHGGPETEPDAVPDIFGPGGIRECT
jgi:hypothetical protein